MSFQRVWQDLKFGAKVELLTKPDQFATDLDRNLRMALHGKIEPGEGARDRYMALLDSLKRQIVSQTRTHNAFDTAFGEKLLSLNRA